MTPADEGAAAAKRDAERVRDLQPLQNNAARILADHGNDTERVEELMRSDSPDDFGGFDFLQTADTAALALAAGGRVDLNRLARVVLASRGCDQSGRWVGFPNALAILDGVPDTSPSFDAQGNPITVTVPKD